MSKLVIDSSVFISYFGTDSNTIKTLNLWKNIEFQKTKIINSTLIVAETMTVLSQQKIPNLKIVYDALKQITTVPLDDQFIENFVGFVSKSPVGLKTSDLIITFLTKHYSATLVTWDKRLLASHICPTLTPTQFISKHRHPYST